MSTGKFLAAVVVVICAAFFSVPPNDGDQIQSADSETGDESSLLQSPLNIGKFRRKDGAPNTRSPQSSDPGEAVLFDAWPIEAAALKVAWHSLGRFISSTRNRLGPIDSTWFCSKPLGKLAAAAIVVGFCFLYRRCFIAWKMACKPFDAGPAKDHLLMMTWDAPEGGEEKVGATLASKVCKQVKPGSSVLSPEVLSPDFLSKCCNEDDAGGAVREAYSCFQRCVDLEIHRCGSNDVSLSRVLIRFVGLPAIITSFGLLAAAFIIKSVLMMAFIHSLLSHLESNRGPIPINLHTAVVTLSAFLGGCVLASSLEAAFNSQDEQHSNRIMYALAMAVQSKADVATLSDKEDGGATLVREITEISDKLVQVAVRGVAAPIFIVFLTALLSKWIGFYALLVVLAFFPLASLTQIVVEKMSAAQTSYQIASASRNGVWQELINSLPAVKCQRFEAMFRQRIEAFRSRELGCLWNLHLASNQGVLIGVLWPRATFFVASALYVSTCQPLNHCGVLVCLFIFHHISTWVGFAIAGASRLASVRSCLARAEDLLREEASDKGDMRKEAAKASPPVPRPKPVDNNEAGSTSFGQELSSCTFGSLFGTIGAARIIAFGFLTVLSQVALLLMDLNLVRWSWKPTTADWSPILPALILGCGGTAFAAVAAVVSAGCSVKHAQKCHEGLLSSVLVSASDSHLCPVYRSRLVKSVRADISQTDLSSWSCCASLAGSLCAIVCPIVLIHLSMPPVWNAAALPAYAAAVLFTRPFCRLSRQLRQQHEALDVKFQAAIAAPSNENGPDDIFTFARCLGTWAQAQENANNVIKQWLVRRIEVCFLWINGLVVLLGCCNKFTVDLGTFGLALTFAVLILSSTEAIVHLIADLEKQIGAIHQAQKRPFVQARPSVGETRDLELVSMSVEIDLSAAVNNGDLNCRTLCGENRHESSALFWIDDDRKSLVASAEELAPLIAKPGQRLEITGEIHILSVNGVVGCPRRLARELRSSLTLSSRVSLRIRGGWLRDGAPLAVRGVCVGFGHGPRVLDDFSMCVFPREKIGIAGQGKTTLFLTLLGLLEPREGVIVLGSVVTVGIGLETLRAAVGIIPQEPLYMKGSLRQNLDPTGEATDEELQEVLRTVGLGRLCGEVGLNGNYASVRAALAADISEEFGPFDVRLIATARQCLLQPPLVLVDSASGSSGEASVRAAVFNSCSHSTVLTSVADPESAHGCDRTIVLGSC